MKCVACGYNLGLEDLYCPHCGTKNMQAEKHNSDMTSFKKEFESTKGEVLKNTRKLNAFAIKLVVIASLIAIIAVAIIMSGMGYEFENQRKEKKIKRNLSTYIEEITQLEKDRDPRGLIIYYDGKGINYTSVKELEKYSVAWQVSKNYMDICDYTVRIVDESQRSDYYSEDECIERTSRLITDMYQNATPKESRHECYEGLEGEYIAYVMQLTQDTVQVYYNLSDEEAESIWTLNKLRLAMLLQEGITRNEQE